MPPPLSVPCAVPDNFKSPVHDALKDPLAVVAVCSVTFHLKSAHAFGDGMRFDDDQLPSSALMPVADGPVTAALMLVTKAARRGGRDNEQKGDILHKPSHDLSGELVRISATRGPESSCWEGLDYITGR